MPKLAKISATLKGMSYRLKPDTIREIMELCPAKVELQRDPENIQDPNAIAVFYLEPPHRGVHIGYVDRAVASELAPRIDIGEVEFEEGWLREAFEDGTGDLQLKFRKQ